MKAMKAMKVTNRVSRTSYLALVGADEDRGVLSVCALVAGPPYPSKRGLAAGVLEVVAALFLPTALRVVVGGIGVLRIVRGLGVVK